MFIIIYLLKIKPFGMISPFSPCSPCNPSLPFLPICPVKPNCTQVNKYYILYQLDHLESIFKQNVSN